MTNNPESVKLLDWDSPELGLIKPDDFPAFYPKAPVIPGLEEEIKRIGGDQLVRGSGYGSAFSGDASKTSLMDMLLVVKNPWSFYKYVTEIPEFRLGTTRMPGFHAEFNLEKGNFYLATVYPIGGPRGVKFWIIPLDELTKHSQGGLPSAPEGKGGLYLAGRMHKAMFPTFAENGIPDEQKQIDLAFNKARIDGVWLALGLMHRTFSRDQLAETYVNLSYAADKRVEQANKSQSLLYKNYDCYQQMLDPVISSFIESGLIRPISGEEGYIKLMSLPEAEVNDWLKKCASQASKTNYIGNFLTMGGRIGYAAHKVIRVMQAKK